MLVKVKDWLILILSAVGVVLFYLFSQEKKENFKKKVQEKKEKIKDRYKQIEKEKDKLYQSQNELKEIQQNHDQEIKDLEKEKEEVENSEVEMSPEEARDTLDSMLGRNGNNSSSSRDKGEG
ncbi:hypothetical protein [Orenia marismortui]|uniref:hypothetical protein n=1 Tax=Orenia marismortui TaxID=46469 RepID=UPI0003A61855|nr:hypothetical protein [Orenia marismortui]